MKKPVISIDRFSKSWAIFDFLTIEKPFAPYIDEEKALAEARAYVASKTTIEPEIVYPHITSMRTSSRVVKHLKKKEQIKVTVTSKGIDEIHKLRDGSKVRVIIGKMEFSYEETK